MYQSCKDKEKYIARMERLKKENLRELSGKREYSDRKKFLRALKALRFGEAGEICLKHIRWMIKEEKKKRIAADTAREQENAAPDYFSDETIAVYTVIFGGYDVLYEPVCCPDNCRFFLISDSAEAGRDSVWKRFEIPRAIKARMSGMSNTEKNRFLKMMPHLLFPKFNYSVYLDGNIRMVTDPTEFINRMPACGLSAHRHVFRDCVFEEAQAIIEQKKAPREAIEEVVRFLRQENMPAHYGLPECPVLVRQHNRPECVKLMEEWWELFERFPYRDQMLLPLVLYRNGIRTEDIVRLGNNVRCSPAFRRYNHPNVGSVGTGAQLP